ncbi:carboxymuconolactone decarboxylase family protein [Nonomuraea sp. NPDC050540]|uniref:carboxymuconolactone decarboxylase family protein n=1 Tax=Nonomuraea sp. NPDC050540 TaxID=3364367 RepID=UPI003794557B
MNLPILTPETAPAESRPILDGIEADLGFVPNLAATIAASPTLLAGFDGLRRAVGDGSFDPVRREVAGVAVGVAVGNAYGVAFHSTVLSHLGVGQDDIEAMRRGAEPREEVHAAVYAFARALVIDRGAVQEAVVRRATAAGLGPADLLQVVTECAFATLVGLVDNLAGRVELDKPLLPQAWK